MNKYLKIFQFSALAIIYKFFAVSVAHAATSTIEVGYPLFVSATSPADFVAKLYTYALGISGTLAVIMIVYGGIKYLTSAGNESALGDAKDIITSSIWGILLLAGAYLVLNTINPQLVELRNPGLQPLPSTPTVGAPPGTQTQQDLDLLKLAAVASSLQSSNKVIFSGSADCSAGSDAKSIINDVANKVIPLVCSSDCNCQRGGSDGGINLSLGMLSSLDELACGSYTKDVIDLPCAKNIPTFMVTSLTGGKHAANSYHYIGKAVDIVLPGNKNSSDWSNFGKALVNTGYYTTSGPFRVICEVRLWTDTNNNGKKDPQKSSSNPNGDNYSAPSVACGTLFDSADYKAGKLDNIHIHAEW